ncbi:MAG: hypothetical protein AAF849_00975 [Bacteroidota bacterium]
MQVEPNNENIDQAFEDQAWSEMKTLLDKEMPVSKKKRRGLLWLFLLFGLFASGIATYHLAAILKKTDKASRSPVEEVIIEDQKKEVRSDRVEASNQKRAISAQRSKVRRESLEERIQKNRVAERLEQEKLQSSPISDNEDREVSNILESEKNTLKEIQAISTANQRLKKYNIDLSTQNALLREIQKHPIEPLTSAIGSITVMPKDAKVTKLEWYLKASSIATLDDDIHFSLGVAAAYPIGNKWRIQSGLNWIFPKQNRSISLEYNTPDAASMDTALAENMEETTAVNTYFESHSDSVLHISRTHHFLSVPLSISYQIHPRFAVYTGGQMNIPLLGEAAEELFKNEDDITNVRTTFASPDLSSLQIQSNLQWHTGFQFRASKHWIFDLSYRHLLPRQSGKNHLERYFELGTRYRF